MYAKDFSIYLERFYYNEVILPPDKLNVLKEKKNLNIKRLEEGLKEYNDEQGTDYHIEEFVVQGSVAMGTSVSSDENDFDIDIAVIMEKSSLPDGTLSSKRIISEALKKKCQGMKNSPDPTGNSITIEYEEGYHIDFALYGKDNDDYFHCGASDWEKRSPRSISQWFNHQNQKKYGMLKKIVKYIKFFCKQDSTWIMPGGLIISVLVNEALENIELNNDIYHILVKVVNKIIDRLKINNEVYNPTDPTINLLKKEKDYDKINNLLTSLEKRISNINKLDDESTAQDYYDAWNYFFGDEYFTDSTNLTLTKIEDPEEEIDNFYIVENYIDNDTLITCQLSSKEGKTDGYTIRNYESGVPLSVGKFRDKILHFRANPKALRPYTIMWKVKNNGVNAINDNALRGEIKYSNYDATSLTPYIDGNQRFEGIKFSGQHYVECYVIKNAVVVEKSKFDVNFVD